MAALFPASSGILHRLLRSVPIWFVFAGLVAIGYWGHANDWQYVAGKSDGAKPVDSANSARPTVTSQGGSGVRIVFDSPETVEKAGIDISTVWRSTLIEQAKAPGKVSFEPSRIARLSARAGGTVRRVLKFPGDRVIAGEILALVDASEVGKAKAEFQHALVLLRHRERTRDDLVGASGATSPVLVREAEAAVKESMVTLLAVAQTLANFGLAVKAEEFRKLAPSEAAVRLRHVGVEDAVKALDADVHSATLIPIRSPLAGILLTSEVVAGEVVEAGKPLFAIVDPSRVWITLHVGSEDARRFAVGQKIFFRPDGETREYPATAVWVGPAADEQTRAIPVRAEADNAAGSLRASTLGRGRIILKEEPMALLVPHEAIHMLHGRSVVFVRDPDFLTGSKAFDVRIVRIGGRDERNSEVLAGLKTGEIVATKGSGALLEELTRATEDRR